MDKIPDCFIIAVDRDMLESDFFDSRYPDLEDLKATAMRRMPKFAFDYIEGGCNEEQCVVKNRSAYYDIELRADILQPFSQSDLSIELFGKRYAAPFGIAPVGLQGLMWPQTPEILAKAAADKNIPFVLSTVSSASLEKIAEISEGNAWFQLYNPTDSNVRTDLLSRIVAARYPVLVVTVDVPTFGYRPRDIRNNLAMPPKITVKSVLQMLARPSWLLQTALTGKPEMQTLKPYMPSGMQSDQLAAFMNQTVMGPVDLDGLKPIRDFWKGPLVLKGIMSERDVESAVALGADAVVISNHGGRQLDAAEPSIVALKRISKKFRGKIKLFVDGGLRNGPDIARAVACGADFTFMGRPFVYGAAALGDRGGYHTINSLLCQFRQVMEQLRCSNLSDLPACLVQDDK